MFDKIGLWYLADISCNLCNSLRSRVRVWLNVRSARLSLYPWAGTIRVNIMLFTTVIKDNKVFQRCYHGGRYAVCSFLCAYYLPNGSPYNRLGITAGKKLGNAVKRNRIKRIIRAAYRLNESSMPMGYDIVFVGRNDAADKSSTDVERFINDVLISEINKAAVNGDFGRKRKKGKG